MEITEYIKRMILDFHQQEAHKLTPRDYEISFVRGMSFSITGPRRSGKSFRTYQFVQEYLKQGNKKENICYLQFNDNKLKNIKSANLNIVDEAYYAIFPEKQNSEEVVFIFDELHRIEGWEDYVLFLLNNPNHKVLITGSTSKLMKGEIASALRGKNFSREMLPFSFKEFMRHYGGKTSKMTSNDEAYAKKIFDDYFHQGGFPGLLDSEKYIHPEILANYWDTMLVRDIVEAHHDEGKIDVIQLQTFVKHLINRISAPMTVRKIIASMRDSGHSISQQNGYNFLKYFEDAYLAFTTSFYSPSEKIRAANHYKVYLVDWNLADCISSINLDSTRLFENLIFIELKRRGFKISYFKTRDGYEIDFVIQDKRQKEQPELIQVCYELSSDKVLEREVRSIDKSYKYLNAKSATIITKNESRTIKRDDFEVSVVPAWKWLLT